MRNIEQEEIENLPGENVPQVPICYDKLKCIEYMVYRCQILDKDLFEVFVRYDKNLSFRISKADFYQIFVELRIKWFLSSQKESLFEEFKLKQKDENESQEPEFMTYLPILHIVYTEQHQLVQRIFRRLCNEGGSSFKSIFLEMQRLNNNYSRYWTYKELSKPRIFI